eukprot:gene29089-38148_t
MFAMMVSCDPTYTGYDGMLHGPECDSQEIQLAAHESGQNEVVATNDLSSRPNP